MSKRVSRVCKWCGHKVTFDVEKHDKHIYNKAIDDFVNFASTLPTVEADDGTIRPMWLEEIAEQLKAGGENDNLRI